MIRVVLVCGLVFVSSSIAVPCHGAVVFLSSTLITGSGQTTDGTFPIGTEFSFRAMLDEDPNDEFAGPELGSYDDALVKIDVTIDGDTYSYGNLGRVAVVVGPVFSGLSLFAQNSVGSSNIDFRAAPGFLSSDSLDGALQQDWNLVENRTVSAVTSNSQWFEGALTPGSIEIIYVPEASSLVLATIALSSLLVQTARLKPIPYCP